MSRFVRSVATRDVVGLARRAVAQDEVDAVGVVGDVQPVAPLQPVPVQRQRPIVDGVRDEQRDELLRVVVRAVRVRAPGDDRVQAVGHDVAPDQQLAGRLGRRVGRARRERIAFAGFAGVHRAVDLVGGDLQEARLTGRRPARLQQDVDADDAGPQERLGVEDRAIDVRFGGEVDDAVGLGDERPDGVGVGDVAAHEAEARGLLRVGPDGRQVRLVPGVRQLVEDGDVRAVPAGRARRGRSTSR